jgi:hypothetical protein
MEWNDAPGRTSDEVIDALMKATCLAETLSEKAKAMANTKF